MKIYEMTAPVMFPEHLRLTAVEQAKLNRIQNEARQRHKKLVKAAKAQGRSYPDFPVECSWAYEEKFRREIRR